MRTWKHCLREFELEQIAKMKMYRTFPNYVESSTIWYSSQTYGTFSKVLGNMADLKKNYKQSV